MNRALGIRADPTYSLMKNVIMHNKIKTHEYQENSKCIIFLYFIVSNNREDN